MKDDEGIMCRLTLVWVKAQKHISRKNFIRFGGVKKRPWGLSFFPGLDLVGKCVTGPGGL